MHAFVHLKIDVTAPRRSTQNNGSLKTQHIVGTSCRRFSSTSEGLAHDSESKQPATRVLRKYGGLSVAVHKGGQKG